MINWTRSRMVWSESRNVVAAQLPLIQEGMAAVSAMEGGVVKIAPSGGATSGIGARLEGVFMSPRRTLSNNTVGVTVTVPATSSYVVLLPNTVLSNADIGCFNASTGTAIAVTTNAASSTNVQAATDSTTGLTSLTFDSTLAGVTYSVFYSYAMSAMVELGLYGNGSPGFWASDMIGSVGIFKIGKIAINNFDPVANWYSGTNVPGVKCIAGGLFTDSAASANGFVPPNVDIVALPTPPSPWLEIEIH